MLEGVVDALEADLARLGIGHPKVELALVPAIERTAANKLKRFVPLTG